MKTIFNLNKARVLVAAGMMLAASAAHADVKIVSHMSGTSMQSHVPEMDMTAYYKGDKVRSDFQDYTTIFDGGANTAWFLNNKDKTYSDLSNAAPETHGMTMTGTATVTPTDEHKTVAGYNTTKYTCNVSLTMNMQGMNQPMTMDMTIDMWTTKDLKTPYSPKMLMKSVGQMLRGMNLSGMKDVMDAMTKIEGFPLEQDITIGSIQGMPGAGTGPMMQMTIVATSVNEGDLADDLFKVPADYKKVDNARGGRS